MALYLSLSVSLSGLVLCVGKQGHVAIESRFAEDCCDDERGSGGLLRLEVADACACIDASLLQPAAGLRATRGLVASGSALPAEDGVARETIVRAHPTRAPVVPAACGSPPLRALRNVVLTV